MIRRFVALTIFAAAVGPLAAAAPESFGTGVSLKDATPIERIIAKPSDFEGKTVRVEGTISPSARTWAAGWRWRLMRRKTGPR